MSSVHYSRFPTLAPGKRIALIAPSSPFDETEFQLGVSRLRTRYRVTYDESIFLRRGFLAGDDDRREQELRAALHDPEVAAILPVRGGYGATRLLRRFDPGAVANKLLIGLSDVTALHCLWQRAGVASVHGQMVAALSRASDHTFDHWCRVVEGLTIEPIIDLETWVAGNASGPLVGGNLALIAALVGTPHLPSFRGAFLLLEDIGERPYRIDRMLTTLRDAGVFQELVGVAVGRFVQCDAGPDGTTAEAVLRERLSDIGVPVVAGIPAGHLDDDLALPLGRNVQLRDEVLYFD